MKIEQTSLADIKEYPDNAKEHPEEQIQHIANSIEQFGFRTPIVIDKAGVIIQGHGRFIASQKLGLEEVPTIRVSDLSKEKIKMLRLADNKVAESEWDEDALGLELQDLADDFDIGDFGFEMEDVDMSSIDSEITKEKVTPYNKYHIMLSMDYANAVDIKEAILEVLEKSNLEVEVNESSN